MWRYYGYQLHDAPREPENDLYSPKTPPNMNLKRSQSMTDDSKQEELGFESPVKSQKFSRLSRSREKKPRGSKVNFPNEGQMSRSLPNYYVKQGFVEKVPISTDDVYELLTRSQAQEAKLAILQAQLLRQQESSQNSSSSSYQSPVRESSGTGSYGNKACPQTGTLDPISQHGMFRKAGCK